MKLRIAVSVLAFLLVISVMALWASLNKPSKGCNLIEYAVVHHGPGVESDNHEGMDLFVDYKGYSVFISAKFTEPDHWKLFTDYSKGQLVEFELLDFSMIRIDGVPLKVQKIESFQK